MCLRERPAHNWIKSKRLLCSRSILRPGLQLAGRLGGTLDNKRPPAATCQPPRRQTLDTKEDEWRRCVCVAARDSRLKQARSSQTQSPPSWSAAQTPLVILLFSNLLRSAVILCAPLGRGLGGENILYPLGSAKFQVKKKRQRFHAENNHDSPTLDTHNSRAQRFVCSRQARLACVSVCVCRSPIAISPPATHRPKPRGSSRKRLGKSVWPGQVCEAAQSIVPVRFARGIGLSARLFHHLHHLLEASLSLSLLKHLGRVWNSRHTLRAANCGASVSLGARDTPAGQLASRLTQSTSRHQGPPVAAAAVASTLQTLSLGGRPTSASGDRAAPCGSRAQVARTRQWDAPH